MDYNFDPVAKREATQLETFAKVGGFGGKPSHTELRFRDSCTLVQ